MTMDIKSERNQLLVEYRDKTGMSFQKLGRAFGISRQRACKLYQKYHQTPQNQNLGGLEKQSISTTGYTAKLIPQWLIDWEEEQNGRNNEG